MDRQSRKDIDRQSDVVPLRISDTAKHVHASPMDRHAVVTAIERPLCRRRKTPKLGRARRNIADPKSTRFLIAPAIDRKDTLACPAEALRMWDSSRTSAFAAIAAQPPRTMWSCVQRPSGIVRRESLLNITRDADVRPLVSFTPQEIDESLFGTHGGRTGNVRSNAISAEDVALFVYVRRNRDSDAGRNSRIPRARLRRCAASARNLRGVRCDELAGLPTVARARTQAKKWDGVPTRT